jgi:hypothetical protein
MDGSFLTIDLIEPETVLQFEKERAEVPCGHLSRSNQLLQGLHQLDLEARLEAFKFTFASFHTNCCIQPND